MQVLLDDGAAGSQKKVIKDALVAHHFCESGMMPGDGDQPGLEIFDDHKAGCAKECP